VGAQAEAYATDTSNEQSAEIHGTAGKDQKIVASN
jgi:hypothetical protein